MRLDGEQLCVVADDHLRFQRIGCGDNKLFCCRQQYGCPTNFHHRFRRPDRTRFAHGNAGGNEPDAIADSNTDSNTDSDANTDSNSDSTAILCYVG